MKRKKKRRPCHEVTPGTDLKEFKVLLGPLANEYSDGQLRQLHSEMRIMAHILLDLYVHKDDVPVIQF